MHESREKGGVAIYYGIHAPKLSSFSGSSKIAPENEHLNNCEGFRRIDIIPLHFETATMSNKSQDKPENASQTAREVGLLTLIVIILAVIAALQKIL